MLGAVYSCEGRVEVMIFKEEFRQAVDKLNSAINAVVAAAQRKPTSERLSLPVSSSSSPCLSIVLLLLSMLLLL